MIRSTRGRGARYATALALASALVLAPTAAFAADGDEAATDEALAGGAVGSAVADSPDAGGADEAAAAPTEGAAAPTEGAAAPTEGAEVPADGEAVVDEPAVEDETPVVDEPAAAEETEAQAAPLPAADATVADGELMNYVVNTDATGAAAVDEAATAVADAGGVVLSEYPEIGVVTAQSTDGEFLAAIRAAQGVESAGPTRTAPVSEGAVAPADANVGAGGTQGIERPLADRAVTADPLEAEQWDMSAIGAPEARQISAGDPGVVVGVLDSGIDVTHPDLAGQVDPSLSVGCAVNGVPDQTQSAWVPLDDSESHGTHVAGTIAAADNGVGIVGIAPDVTLASVKVVNHDGYIYPEYALCGFMWAADEGFDVTNNSYYVDPYEYWCSTEADQAPALEAVTRAVEYSETQGVLSVAAAGNSSYDLANKTTNDSSPNDSTPVVGRDVSEGCYDMPTEIDGVVSVSALREGADGQPEFEDRYSNFGEGVIDVSAPGSDVLSTVFGGLYESYNGTSMASPHVAGVAALLASTHPDASPAELQALLESQATPRGDSALYGAGVVDAFAAVTEDLGLGPVAAVADGTVQAGAPFRVLGANFEPGETVTVEGLTGSFTADELGRLDGPAVLSPLLEAGVVTLQLTGSEGSSTTLELIVEAAIAGPSITAPTAGQVVEPGTVTVSGTAEADALVVVTLGSAADVAALVELEPVLPAAQARSTASVDASASALASGSAGSSAVEARASAAAVVADPVPYDPALGGASALVQTDATGAWSVPVTGVPAGDLGVTALQVLPDGTTSTFTEPVLFTVAAAVVVPVDGADPVPLPEPVPGTVVVPVRAPVASGALAYTGSEPTPLAGVALAMLAAGTAAVAAAGLRRRRLATVAAGTASGSASAAAE